MVNNMPDTEKNTPVHFVMYEPYETFPNIIETLGVISDAEVKNIMSAFNTKTYAPTACIRSMSLEHSDHANFGRIPGGSGRHRSLELSGMFFFDQKPLCIKCSKKMNEASKIKCCARNLRNGKCHDEFICHTLGAILFPQHYAQDKQK